MQSVPCQPALLIQVTAASPSLRPPLLTRCSPLSRLYQSSHYALFTRALTGPYTQPLSSLYSRLAPHPPSLMVASPPSLTQLASSSLIRHPG
ncbi:hypothetical protein Pmani_019753 [Petrolisthes manimaculis]|uniref:Uncharacterized protein n=1 Tax=Petrolisthes manimaculis TaxID=1843537 RepID=A0AAE1PHN4_9EUCA|nr:hypothetical protein Pmani_019753 [Petrolisthes manimaculis]